jgi:FMN phosphatase YigB (HAD superfamily)|tara:strand:+ start:1394 stop:1726 length:333 start_codon:yes stop_codon:yes gene_type:complete
MILKYKDFLNEKLNKARKGGPKTNKFSQGIDGVWDWFTDADEGGDEKLPKEYHAALKKVGCKKEDCVVVFGNAVGDAAEIRDEAKKAGIKYVELDDKETGDMAIVFDGQQ